MVGEPQIRRRTFLRTTAGAALVACGVGKSAAATRDETENEEENGWFHSVDRTVFDSKWATNPDAKILPGTRFETGVYINDSGTDGPTAVIVAGQHGDEISAQYAALFGNELYRGQQREHKR